jgi:hypothetical protein
MKPTSAVLRGWLLAACGAAVASAAGIRSEATPTYTNAQVVSIDALNRTLLIRKGNGEEQTVELDDNVAGLRDIRAGDHAILTLRGEPGRPRVSAISRSTAATNGSTATPARPEPAPRPLPPTNRETADVALDAFATQVANLAQEAARVDRLWGQFRHTCDVSVGSRYEGAREWFAIWGNDVRADLSSGFCRDLFNQVVSQGETVKRGMAGAEEAARRSLSPGEIRDVRLRHSMDWEGWTRTPPDRLEP